MHSVLLLCSAACCCWCCCYLSLGAFFGSLTYEKLLPPSQPQQRSNLHRQGESWGLQGASWKIQPWATPVKAVSRRKSSGFCSYVSLSTGNRWRVTPVQVLIIACGESAWLDAREGPIVLTRDSEHQWDGFHSGIRVMFSQ